VAQGLNQGKGRKESKTKSNSKTGGLAKRPEPLKPSHRMGKKHDKQTGQKGADGTWENIILPEKKKCR